MEEKLTADDIRKELFDGGFHFSIP